MHPAHVVEALGGTLKAAKKRKLIDYDSELLLQGEQEHAFYVPPAGLCTAEHESIWLVKLCMH